MRSAQVPRSAIRRGRLKLSSNIWSDQRSELYVHVQRAQKHIVLYLCELPQDYSEFNQALGLPYISWS